MLYSFLDACQFSGFSPYYIFQLDLSWGSKLFHKISDIIHCEQISSGALSLQYKKRQELDKIQFSLLTDNAQYIYLFIVYFAPFQTDTQVTVLSC